MIYNELLSIYLFIADFGKCWKTFYAYIINKSYVGAPWCTLIRYIRQNWDHYYEIGYTLWDTLPLLYRGGMPYILTSTSDNPAAWVKMETDSILSGHSAKSSRYSSVGAASQWWSNERMMVYFKLMMVKWVYDHTLISQSLTSISPSLTSILPSSAWSTPSFAHLTIIEKLNRLQKYFCMVPFYLCRSQKHLNKYVHYAQTNKHALDDKHIFVYVQRF